MGLSLTYLLHLERWIIFLKVKRLNLTAKFILENYHHSSYLYRVLLIRISPWKQKCHCLKFLKVDLLPRIRHSIVINVWEHFLLSAFSSIMFEMFIFVSIKFNFWICQRTLLQGILIHKVVPWKLLHSLQWKECLFSITVTLSRF